MNYYTVKVTVRDSDGKDLKFETDRNFKSDKEAFIFASGFEAGLAQACNAIPEMKEITKIKR
jgi:hypothetical protein